jgi:hypothetical protein
VLSVPPEAPFEAPLVVLVAADEEEPYFPPPPEDPPAPTPPPPLTSTTASISVRAPTASVPSSALFIVLSLLPLG